MNVEIYVHAVLLLLCFVASAFFSGTETGILCVNRMRVMHLVRSGVRSAKKMMRHLQDMQRFMATILVANNMANVMISVLSAKLATLVFPQNSTVQTIWACVVAAMVVVFSEYLPKLFFSSRPLRRTLHVIAVFDVVERVVHPLAQVALYVTSIFLPRGKGGDDAFALFTREYIEDVISDPKDGTQITSIERAMIHRVLGLHDRTAEQIMTPIEKVARIHASSTMQDCFRLVRDSGHIRFPVFSDDGSTCVGVLSTLDVFAIAPHPEHVAVRTLMRPPIFVDAQMPADDLLPLMRKKRQHLVLVRNNQRAVLGIITTENIMNVLTGSIAISAEMPKA